MPTYAVEYAERKTGRTHTTKLDAGSPDEAADFVRNQAKDIMIGEVKDITPAAQHAPTGIDYTAMASAFAANPLIWKRLTNSIMLAILWIFIIYAAINIAVGFVSPGAGCLFRLPVNAGDYKIIF